MFIVVKVYFGMRLQLHAELPSIEPIEFNCYTEFKKPGFLGQFYWDNLEFHSFFDYPDLESLCLGVCKTQRYFIGTVKLHRSQVEL